jgi:hypothetical protein
VGLVWGEPGGYVARRGCDGNGGFYAQVQGHNGSYGIYFAPWAVSDDASQWLSGFETVEEAMAAADRYVAGYLDAAANDNVQCRSGERRPAPASPSRYRLANGRPVRWTQR